MNPITTTNKTNKNQKTNLINVLGSDITLTAISRKKDTIMVNDERNKREDEKAIRVSMLSRGEEVPKRLGSTRSLNEEVIEAFRPARTLSRSPARKNEERNPREEGVDVEEIRSEDDNIFSRSTVQSIVTNLEKEAGKSSTDRLLDYDPESGGIGLSLSALYQIIEMIESTNNKIITNLNGMQNVNNEVKNACSEMRCCLTKAKKLARSTAIVYQKEKKEVMGMEAMSNIIQQQLMKMSNIKRNDIEEKIEINENRNKRKDITPTETGSTKKRTRTNIADIRVLPKIRNIEYLKKASEGGSSESEWEEVRNKKKKRINEVGKETTRYRETEQGTEKKIKKGTTPSRKGEAVSIQVDKNMTFAEATKKLKQKMGQEVSGVKRIRQTRTGDILVEFKNKEDSVNFHERAKVAMGEKTVVKHLTPKIKIEILDIDLATERDEVIEQVSKETGIKREELICRTLRRAYMGTQAAIIEGPAEILTRIKENKIKIGWVFCRVRQLPNIIRCYKCHNLGHVASYCTVVEGDVIICRRCGSEGHTMTECTSEKPKCKICEEEGYTGIDLMHIAGSLRCLKYKEKTTGRTRYTQNSR